MKKKVDYKELYLPPQKPMVVQVPEIKFFMIDGVLDLEDDAHGER